MPPLRLRLRGDCGLRPDTSGALSRGGWSPASRQEPERCPLNQAHAFAFSLATTLMVTIVIFQAGDGSLSVVPANEYDGDAAAIVHEVDPFAL